MPRKKTIIIKDYPARKISIGILSLPLLMIVSSLIGAPIVIFSGTENYFLLLIATLIAELLVVVIGLKYALTINELKQWKSFLKLDTVSWKWLGIGALTGIGMTILLQVVSIMFALITGSPIESSDTTVNLTSNYSVTGLITMLLLVPFIVPIVEEILFRGFIMGSLTEGFTQKNTKRPLIWSVLISSVIFAIAHFQGLSSTTDIFLLLWIFGVSVINAILVLKSNSLYTSIASHSAYNLSSVLLVLAFGV